MNIDDKFLAPFPRPRALPNRAVFKGNQTNRQTNKSQTLTVLCKHSLQHLIVFKQKSEVKIHISQNYLYACLEENHLAIKELNMLHSPAV